MSNVDRVVRCEKNDGIATVWLANPAKRNAMGQRFFAELPEAMCMASAADVRAVVIAAEGPAFTVGLDLMDMGATLAPGGNQIETRNA